MNWQNVVFYSSLIWAGVAICFIATWGNTFNNSDDKGKNGT